MRKRFVRECGSPQVGRKSYGKNRRLVGSGAAGASFVSAQVRGFSMRIRGDPIRCAGIQLSRRFMTPFTTFDTRLPWFLVTKKSPRVYCSRRFVFFCPPSWAEDINIYFKASPRLELLHPYSDPATLTLLVTGTDGKPVAQGRVAIGLEAPEPGWFFSTDFPLVEGSRLLDMSLPLRQGRAEWKYLFPIRGQYRLTVEFIAPDGRKVNKTFPLAIRENKQKWFFLGIFTLGLFALGVLAGRIFTGALSNAKRRAAACLLVSMSCVSWSIEVAAQELGQQKYFGWLEIDPATVGKPSSCALEIGGRRKRPRAGPCCLP